MDNQAQLKIVCSHCGECLAAEPDMVGIKLECLSFAKTIAGR